MGTYQSKYTGEQIDENLSKVENIDTTPTEGSSNLVTSKGIKTYIDGLIGDIESLLQEV